MTVISGMLDHIELPKFTKIKQNFDANRIDDITKVVNEGFLDDNIKSTIKEGQKFGITVGSRGISNLKEIVKSLCDNIKELGATPYIIPSMGSHGAATAKGQRKIIEDFGVTEEYVGAEILASMEVIDLGVSDLGLSIYYDKLASELDGVIVLNRIKAHTDITSDVESGLQKIMAVGLGNHKGAQNVHDVGLGNSAERIKSIARGMIDRGNIVFGVGILENQYDETSHIPFIPKDKIIEDEPKWLILSKEQLPTFLFNDIDVLIVDEIGKNITGDGMDPNIIGRSMIGIKNENIKINKIVTLDTTKESGSNAYGVGLSDITTKRMFDKIELEAMYANGITATVIKGVRIPIAMDTDKLAIQLAIRLCFKEKTSDLRIARIENTLNLGEMFVSEAIAKEITSNENIEILDDLKPMQFNADDNLF